MPLLECGCWEGSWRLSTVRPMCAAHGGLAATNSARRLAEQLRGSVPPKSGPAAIAALMPQLIAAIHTEAGKAEASDEHGAFDAWQVALATLRQLREQVERAQKASATP